MLTPLEKIRKNELLTRFNRFGGLAPSEGKELQDLVSRDVDIDDNTKAMLLFAIGVILVVALSKK